MAKLPNMRGLQVLISPYPHHPHHTTPAVDMYPMLLHQTNLGCTHQLAAADCWESLNTAALKGSCFCTELHIGDQGLQRQGRGEGKDRQGAGQDPKEILHFGQTLRRAAEGVSANPKLTWPTACLLVAGWAECFAARGTAPRPLCSARLLSSMAVLTARPRGVYHVGSALP